MAVFSCKGTHVAGLSGDGGTLVSDSTQSMECAIAREVAHVVQQHSREPAAFAQRLAINEVAALMYAAIAVRPLWRRGLQLPAVLVGAAAVWRAATGPLAHPAPESAGAPLQGDMQLPLLLPGDPGFYLATPEALASRAICMQLEADQVALHLLAGWVQGP